MKNTIMSAQPYGQPRASSYLRTIWPGGRQYAGDAATQLLSITVVCAYRYQLLMAADTFSMSTKHEIQPECGYGQADAGRDCRTRLARPNSQARTGTGKS